MAIDLPPKLWTPPKPSIIQANTVPRTYAEAKGIAAKAALPGMAAIFGGRLPNPKAFSYLSKSEQSGTGANFNFSVNVGAADPTLRIIVGYSGNANGRTFSSGTLDGVSLGIVTDGSNTAELVQSSNATAGLLIAHLPSSSGSVTFDFNWSGTQNADRTGFSFWRYTGDGITSTAIDVDKQNLDNSAMTLTSVAGGFVVGYGFNNSGSMNTPLLGGLTQDNFVANMVNTAQAHAGGWGPTTGSSITAGIDFTGGGTIRPQVYATF